MTPFAKLSRQFRKDRGLLLGDVADRLECSPSFLSQVESGASPIPTGLPGRIAAALELTRRDALALENAAAHSARSFRIDMPKTAPEQDREMAHRLAVGFARMSTAKKSRILEILRERD